MPVDVTAPAALLKTLSEPVRWRIVELLAHEDLCVCHLVEELDIPQPLVSHHLRVLRQAGVVGTEPCGAFTYYLLNRELIASAASTLARLGTRPTSARRRACA